MDIYVSNIFRQMDGCILRKYATSKGLAVCLFIFLGLTNSVTAEQQQSKIPNDLLLFGDPVKLEAWINSQGVHTFWMRPDQVSGDAFGVVFPDRERAIFLNQDRWAKHADDIKIRILVHEYGHVDPVFGFGFQAGLNNPGLVDESYEELRNFFDSTSKYRGSLSDRAWGGEKGNVNGEVDYMMQNAERYALLMRGRELQNIKPKVVRDQLSSYDFRAFNSYVRSQTEEWDKVNMFRDDIPGGFRRPYLSTTGCGQATTPKNPPSGGDRLNTATNTLFVSGLSLEAIALARDPLAHEIASDDGVAFVSMGIGQTINNLLSLPWNVTRNFFLDRSIREKIYLEHGRKYLWSDEGGKEAKSEYQRRRTPLWKYPLILPRTDPGF